MDDPDKRGPADRMRIDVNESWEVRYWTAELGCSEDQLRGAVEAVGPMRDDVARYLARR
jgi:hypothetical protein